jgi:hypothetical protein
MQANSVRKAVAPIERRAAANGRKPGPSMAMPSSLLDDWRSRTYEVPTANPVAIRESRVFGIGSY